MSAHEAHLAPLINKMGLFVDLNEAAIADIHDMPFRFDRVRQDRQLIREGATVRECAVICDGYAHRYNVAASGKRLIVGLLMPGDGFDLRQRWLPAADHNVVTTTTATIGWVPAEAVYRLGEQHPAIGQALNTDLAVEASILRESLLNIGVRSAKSRIAHLLCEFIARRATAGVPMLTSFQMPLNQTQIADATGVTPVHANRMMREIFDSGALARTGRTFVVRDWQLLCSIGDFDADYLHQLGAAVHARRGRTL